MKHQLLSDLEIASFCMELSLLLHAGVGVGDGLALLAEDAEGESARLLSEMADEADFGTPLSEILKHTGRFPTYVTGLVEIGQQSGRTEEALQALSHYYEDRDRMDRQVRASLTYPAILLLLMLVVIVILLVRVLPVFRDVYASLGGQLTGVAGGLLHLGQALGTAMPVLCVLLAAALVLLGGFTCSQSFRTRILTAWRRKFGDKGVSRSLGNARFAQAMAMGLRSGLPLEETLELAAMLLGDVPSAAGRCTACKEQLEQGVNLADALKQAEVLPPAACRLLALGLRGGSGDQVMEEIARRLGEDAEEELETKVGRIEPALVLATSILVGAILLSVMLPLMHIMAAIG